MGAYIPMLVWLIGAYICYLIARKRNVKANLFRQLLVVFLGPFAVPFIFFARPEKTAEM